jgi:hypothetical protein
MRFIRALTALIAAVAASVVLLAPASPAWANDVVDVKITGYSPQLGSVDINIHAKNKTSKSAWVIARVDGQSASRQHTLEPESSNASVTNFSYGVGCKKTGVIHIDYGRDTAATVGTIDLNFATPVCPSETALAHTGVVDDVMGLPGIPVAVASGVLLVIFGWLFLWLGRRRDRPASS